MRAWGLGAMALLAVIVAGCSSNSTAVGVTVSGPGASPLTVLVNSSVTFGATVSGASATTVTWQVCLPATSTSTTAPPSVTTIPTVCTTIPGVTPPSGSTVLTGYGTITQTGQYTAPSTVPRTNTAVILAVSTVDRTAFGTFNITIDSGLRVQVSPTPVTIGPGETFQFTATVTGSSNSAVAWSVCQSPSTGCGLSTLGTVSSTGLYTAPVTSPGSVVVVATSAADATQFGVASVTIASGTDATLTSLDPGTAVQGSVQQDIYLKGSNFLNSQSVLVNGVVVPSTFINTTLLRATVPVAQLTQAGAIPVRVRSQNGDLSAPGPINLNVIAMRPAIVGASPDSVTQNNASANVNLTGGYFSSANTTATFNGLSASQCPATVLNSRQWCISTPTGALSTPGLYPIIVQNAGIAAGQPSISALNLAVTPNSIPGAAIGGAIGVGIGPSAVAIDEADAIAVVTNKGSNSVSLVNLASNTVTNTITVGSQPTGVAVDDLLSHPLALVVNSADQTVSTIDLTTKAVVGAPLSVSVGTGSAAAVPYSIGINSLSHRAIVAYQSTNVATILDLSTGTPTVVQQIGGGFSLYSTGISPAVAIDPVLNWAVVTPGGGGTTSIVDLGIAHTTLEPLGRTPQVIGSLSISTSIQGVGINPETHQALLTDPQSNSVSTFSLLDNTVTTITTTNTATLIDKGYFAAAATPLENVGIAVGSSSTSPALIVDMESGLVLQTVTGLGTNPAAVAVDPANNEAVVVNQGSNTVSIVSLGPAVKPLQILESSPGRVAGGPGTASVNLTITGSGFGGGSEVFLDGVALPTIDVNVVSARRIVATVPGSMLTGARRYIVQVQNPGLVSNVTDLTVIQPVTVGTTPIGIAVDADRDLAVVTNSGSGSVSIVSLAAPSPASPQSLGAVGIIGSPISVGTKPEGVAVIPRLGLAVVANNGSNNATVVDVTQTNIPVTLALCGTSCLGPTGVAIDQDIAEAVVTNSNPGTPAISGSISTINLLGTPAVGSSLTVDQNPIAVAIDPVLDYVAVATASQSSSVQFFNLLNSVNVGRVAGSGIQNPTGIVFDPLNQVFLVANSLLNDITIIDPATLIQTPVRVGIGPTSLDYNFQTSTLVTVNSVSHTMSVLSYSCPPSGAAPTCLGPQVRTVIGLGGTQTTTPVYGPNAVAIDLKLNLAVLADPDNNRVLLVPLPH